MFKKAQDLEQDFMQYNADNDNHNTNEKSFLGKAIQVLIILVLLGVLVVMGMLLYKYLQKDILGNNTNEITNIPSNSDQTKKVYTQEDMQAIMQMVMTQMENKQTDKKDALVEVLKTTKVDQVKNIDNNIKSNIKKIDQTKKVQNKKNTNTPNHYNKVVVSSSDSKEDEMINLSKGLDEIVLTQDTPKSEYTKLISKEVSTRTNEMRVIVVQSGDSLSLIAERAYGSSQAYDILLQANPELIKNPNLIHVGQRLRVPLI